MTYSMMENTISLETRFGRLEAQPQCVLHFENSLLGFEALHRFTLLSPAEFRPLVWLQSLEEPALALPMLNPDSYFPGYSDRVCQSLGEDVTVLCLVSRQQGTLGLNLLAPVLIAEQSSQARQLVLEGEGLDVFHPLGTPLPC